MEKRQIHDNILITNETFHHMKLKKKGREYEMAVKSNMNKAYDGVEWDFFYGCFGKKNWF